MLNLQPSDRTYAFDIMHASRRPDGHLCDQAPSVDIHNARPVQIPAIQSIYVLRHSNSQDTLKFVLCGLASQDHVTNEPLFAEVVVDVHVHNRAPD